MNRSEMIAAVERLLVADGTEEELDRLLDKLVETVPGAGISDLIYWSDQERAPEQIVEAALAAQSILLDQNRRAEVGEQSS